MLQITFKDTDVSSLLHFVHRYLGLYWRLKVVLEVTRHISAHDDVMVVWKQLSRDAIHAVSKNKLILIKIELILQE